MLNRIILFQKLKSFLTHHLPIRINHFVKYFFLISYSSIGYGMLFNNYYNSEKATSIMWVKVV